MRRNQNNFFTLRACHRPLDREFFLKFSKFFRKSDVKIRKSKRRRARDTLVVKVSAQSDAWRPKKRRKTETKIFEKFWIGIIVFRYFGKVFEELQPNGPHHLLPRQISL